MMPTVVVGVEVTAEGTVDRSEITGSTNPENLACDWGELVREVVRSEVGVWIQGQSEPMKERVVVSKQGLGCKER